MHPSTFRALFPIELIVPVLGAVACLLQCQRYQTPASRMIHACCGTRTGPGNAGLIRRVASRFASSSRQAHRATPSLSQAPHCRSAIVQTPSS
ncbi:hypothetical protein C8T65DRAFT_31442 [Cerioporus squamosus]|nr:hypothetical protein C8T65DRAFT_31442 [Cerioporus squamosus]